MARAMQLFMFVIALNGAIALVNGMGLFSQNYSSPEGSVAYQVSDLGEVTSITGEPTIMDYFAMTVMWIWEALIFIVKFIAAFVFIYPVLVNQLHVPPQISIFLQGMIYVVMIWFLVQWKSGRSFGGMM